jgi:hypothetical protein
LIGDEVTPQTITQWLDEQHALRRRAASR